mgnify:CR=1 FL=1
MVPRPVLVIGAIAAAFAAGFATYLYVFPRSLMDTTLTRIAEAGDGVNTWRPARRASPESRRVVRPSPDLAYAICVYDLSNGPVRLTIAPWKDYWSISLYAINTDNFWTRNDVNSPNGVDVAITKRSDTPVPAGVVRVVSPSQRGAALVRRLAPTDDAYGAAAELNQTDVCRAIGN